LERTDTLTPPQWRRLKRRDAGLTQEQLARKMGVTLKTVQNYEREDGGTEPKAEHFLRFCSVVGVDPREAPYTWVIPGLSNHPFVLPPRTPSRQLGLPSPGRAA
jgi:transcriptional regulator with XRE-family HTH domain